MSLALKADSRNHWDIPKTGKKPPPGLGRSNWLDLKALRRHQSAINQLLDRIAPELRQNVAIELQQDVVACEVLDYIESLNSKTAKATTARLILIHLQRGMNSYCREHDLPRVRLPLLTALGIDEGLLDGKTLSDYRIYRQLVNAWPDFALGNLTSKEELTTTQISGLLIMSSALFGGLYQQAHWIALIDRLKYPLHCLGKTVHFDLGEDFAWQADPVSETLLRRLHHKNLLPMQFPRRPSLTSLLRPYFEAAVVSTSNPAAQLQAATKSMLALHFAPDIASIALGLLPNSRLPKAASDRIIHSCHKAPQRELHISATRTGGGQKFPEVMLPPMAAFLSRVSSAISWDKEENRNTGLQTIANSRPELKYREELSRSLKQISADFQHYCLAEGVNGSSSFHYAILCFVDDLIHLGGIRKEILAPATIDAYASAALQKLKSLAVADLHQISSESRANIYTNAIHGSGKSRADIEVAIKLFERTLLTRLDIEDEVDWSSVPLATMSRTNVDANLIDPITYANLLSVLQAADIDSDAYRDLLLALSVVLYRFGLRTGEAHELTLADLNWLPDGSVLLHVRRSQLTSNKSVRAIRDVGPILLPSLESQYLRRHWDRRAAESENRLDPRKIYLFARPGHGSSLLGRTVVFDPITRILRWLTSDDSLKIRHFRHGFASRLFLAGRTSHAELDELQVRPAIWQQAYRSDGAWLRCYEMGHLSPTTSIESYVHTATLAHYHYSCQVVAEQLSPQTLSIFAGLGERTIEREMNRAIAQGVTSRLPSMVDYFLKSTRTTWPLPASSDTKTDQKMEFPRIQLALHEGYHSHPTKRTPPMNFEQVFGVVSDRLVNKLDLTKWEIAGVPSSVARDWVTTTDALTRIGVLGKDYHRRPRLSPQLIKHGELLLRHIAINGSTGLPLLLARAIVGMHGPGAAIRMDPILGRRLVNWFNCGEGESPVATLDEGTGKLVEIRLDDRGTDAVKGFRLLLILFAIMLLSADQVGELIEPFQKV